MSREIVVTAAVRTGIGEFGGSLKDIPPTELGAIVVKEVLARGQLALGSLHGIEEHVEVFIRRPTRGADDDREALLRQAQLA